MRFVVVTGMSGGGKSTALRMLEDAGFYCVDNLPVPLIEKFVELIATPGGEVTKVALGLDVRAVGECLFRVRVGFNHKTVCSGSDSGKRKRLYIVADTSSVARIYDNRKVAFGTDDWHGA